MKIIGLTGGIASGKSTVATLIKENYGLPIIDADQLSREAVLPFGEGMCRIAKAFGSEVVLPDGNLNRPQMGEKIYASPEMRDQLNGILHPIIDDLYKAKLKKYAAEGKALIIYDCPLLIETGYYKDVDEVLLIVTVLEERVKRIMERDGVSKAMAEKKINIQMTDEEKIKYADTVMYNNGSVEDLKRALDSYIKSM